MKESKRPNVALALTPNDAWRERYQTRLRRLCPDATAEALGSDNDLTVQGRMLGAEPERCAENMAGELKAWSAPSQSLVRHSWRENDAIYVVGCIDAYGSITANPSRGCRTHRPEESKGKRWRWCVRSQEMAWGIPGRTREEINDPRLNELTDDEFFAVWNWLRKRGFADDRSMPNE